MIATLFAIGCAASLATFAGGKLALKFQDRLHLVLGFSAGAVVGVALFDLLPEAIEQGGRVYPPPVLAGMVAVGFVFYMFVDRAVAKGSGVVSAGEPAHAGDGRRGHLGAGSLTLHSFLDGLGIGLAFQVSTAVGAIVAIGVLAHDFSDGINTVHLSLVGGTKEQNAGRWLIADALAPIAGIACTLLIRLPEHQLALILAVFCGFFLYIGASTLLPESHHRHPRFWTSCATVLGLALIYSAVRLAGA